ncbi:hypothetical protein F4678DRAFT_463408 [Xylaria arbuscula]|nr:hypothetical protein F4678DRAFT_463408 [Xylaria arbuscula]
MQFKGIIWTGFALCVIAFSSRISIRAICFRRLFVEDYLMLTALLVLLVTTTLGQLYLRYVYDLIDVSNGVSPSPNFPSELSKGLRSFAVFMVLNYVGVWLIKLNFLLFFRRLGNHVDKYRYFWWLVVLLNLAAVAACIGLIQYQCVSAPTEFILAHCGGATTITRTKISASLDAITDGLIIAFPLWVLWGCKLSIHKKLALSGLFGLVALTILVTIVRGSILGGVYQSVSEHNMKELNIAWVWLWFNIEFIVAFIVGCLVSFRALFQRNGSSLQDTDLQERRRKAALRARSKSGEGPHARLRRLQEQLTTTFMLWEATMIDGEGHFNLPCPEAGEMSLNFERGYRPSTDSSSTEPIVRETASLEPVHFHTSTQANS